MRDRRRRREFAVLGDHHLHAIGRQNFERAVARPARTVRACHAEEQRAVDALRAPVFADRLRDREDVPFVEAARERGAAVSRRAEGDALRRDADVGPRS